MTTSVFFEGKDPNEHLQFYFRQHWIRLFWSFLKALGLSVIVLAIGWVMLVNQGVSDSYTRHITLAILFVIFCAIHLHFLNKFYHHFLYMIIVSDRSVHRIKKTLITTDEHESINLSVLQDIHKFQRGVTQNVLGFGTLHLEAQDTHLKIHFIPHIAECHHRLTQMRELARHQGVAAS